MNDGAICPLPWVSLSFNADTSLRVCCNTSHGGRVKDEFNQNVYLKELDSVSQLRNLATYLKLRSEMMAGVRPEFCNACYNVEDNGGKSIRQYYLDQYQNKISAMLSQTTKEGSTTYALEDLDLSLSNKCNLKCRMCTPGASYLLKSDFEKLEIPFDKISCDKANNDWTYEGLLAAVLDPKNSNINQILFTGGEPLTNSNHLKILKSLVDKGGAKDITLKYHSNLMKLPLEVLELWKKFKKIELHISLEAVGEKNDYIRYGSNWAEISQNIKKIIEIKKIINIWVEIHTVFQALNLFSINELLNFLRPYENDFASFPHFIWIDNPASMSATVLTKDLKMSAIKLINSNLEENLFFYMKSKHSSFNLDKIRILKSHLLRLDSDETDTAMSDTFYKHTTELDKLRNQDVKQVFPELKFFFERQENTVK